MGSVPPTGPNDGSVVVAPKDVEAYALAVDPFLVEALQNPRHRLTSKLLPPLLLRFMICPSFGFFARGFGSICSIACFGVCDLP